MKISEETNTFILENLGKKNLWDDKFLEKLRVKIVNDNDLGDYVEKIELFDLSNLKCVACLDVQQKLIVVDPNSVKKQFKIIKGKYIKNISYKRFYNFYLFLTLFHEFTHAYQRKLFKELKNTNNYIEVLRDSHLFSKGYVELDESKKPNVFQKIMANNVYQVINRQFPIERHADISAYSIMYPLYREKFTDDLLGIEDIKNLYLTILEESYSFSNNYNNSPVKEFYTIIKQLKKFDSLNFSEYDFVTKVKYGLPVSKSQYYSALDIILNK